MLENNPIPLIVIGAILYGMTMKVADLLNEHGLKWFRGSAVFLGVLWGVFGSLLVISNQNIANIILAMNIAFIIRNRLDFLNHQIAAAIIIISFLFFSTFNPTLFVVFFIIFLIFGSLKDYVGDILKKKGMLATLNEAMLYYPIPTFTYCSIYGNWIIFWAFLLYTVSYDCTKYIAKKRGYE
ncbi:hypothetical protein KJ969_00235 [Patescibacteria group bacterium]|nr:hypothetical protein [Patescibacteria group bacterium]MBU1921933.1 hypothetical protein [Patescibacteria group bacterium]